jgi:Terminase RNaseH-like domain
VTLEITDLGYGPDLDEEVEEPQPLTAEDEEAEDFIELDEDMAGFMHELTQRILVFCEELAGFELFPYQRAFGYRMIESLILGDAEEVTGLLARQSGKSETVATVLAGCMVLFPKLSKTFPIMEKFKRGLWIGIFAPVDDQADLVFSRIVSRLTSDIAVKLLLDPEIDEAVEGKSKIVRLKGGSFCRRQTANPRAKIEGSSYHVVVVDEAQDADEQVVRKSIHPMLAFYAGTMVKIGTPGYTKGDFYKAINLNKRRMTSRRSRQNHFEFDDRIVSKYNPSYKKFIEKEKYRLGEDSDEFQMSYRLKWLLDRGMLITEDDLDSLADPSMRLVQGWYRTPCVVGLDPARVRDSTVVTVMWVDWDFPDAAGYREHRILNWLEIHNTDWEEQYFQIMEFLDNYNLAFMGVDAQGMGSAVADRMKRLLGSRCEVIAYPSDSKNQSERWKHLIQLMQRKMFVYPGHSKARRTRVWRRFRQQMVDAEKIMKGQYLLIEAPDERGAFDDYVDSSALACACSMMETVPVVEQINSPFYGRGVR